jgi:hypothetical protein
MAAGSGADRVAAWPDSRVRATAPSLSSKEFAMRRFSLILAALFAFAPLLALLPGPAAAQESTTQPGVTGNAYKSPIYGYKLTWDASWSVEASISTKSSGSDTLGLTNGSSGVVLESVPYTGSLAACPASAAKTIMTSPHISNGRPRMGANGKPVAGATASAAYVEYTDTLAAQDGSSIDLIDRIECRWIVSGKSALIIDEEIQQSAEAQQTPAVQSLLA